MFGDPGFLSLVVIFALWITLIFLALGTALRPRNWKKRGLNKRSKPADIHSERQNV